VSESNLTITGKAKFAFSYYLGMFLLLLSLVISVMRHIEDVRLEEAVILIALAATILFAILAAWRAASGAKKE
jgi:Kef-type K+ transport system membrane component KefB